MEVDLIYPKPLHDEHHDFLLAPEHLRITYDMFSEYQKKLLERLNINFQHEVKKLVPNLFDKAKYVTHYRNLKYYLQKGLILKKIHRVLSFKQSPWLRDYIQQ